MGAGCLACCDNLLLTATIKCERGAKQLLSSFSGTIFVFFRRIRSISHLFFPGDTIFQAPPKRKC